MLIYLLRHGAVAQQSPRRFLGQSDVPLSPLGVAQARAMGRRLRSIRFAEVFSSPLSRAVHTARLASGLPEEVIRRVEAFREIDLGVWEGLSVAEVQARYPGAYEARGADLAHFRPPGGESFADVAARACPALLDIAGKASGPMLLVAHAGVNRVLLAAASGLPLQEIFTISQGYGELYRLRYQDGDLQVLETAPCDSWEL